jgi:flagellin
MVIQHNIAALNANRQLTVNNNSVSKSLARLSSGYRINSASDDAAGLAISEKMKSQITGLEKASDNAEDGISLIQTGEGALTEVHSMLNRMVELATQSANGTYGRSERSKLNDEVTNLKSEIDRIADSTNFNGTDLLNGNLAGESKAIAPVVASKVDSFNASVYGAEKGVTVKFVVAADTSSGADDASITGAWSSDTLTLTIESGKAGTITQADIDAAIADVADDASTKAGDGFAVKVDGGINVTAATAADATGDSITTTKDVGSPLTLQVGDTAATFNQIAVGVSSMKATDLGLDDVDISTQEGAKAALSTINAAIETVSSARSNFGALQNRLEHTVNNLGTTTQNLTSAESRIRDVDMAGEMMEFTKNNILTQASQAMLAQANQLPQGVLQLLQ